MERYAGTFRILENWEIITKDANTGEILSEEKICNLIVNSGLNLVRDLIGNLSTPDYVKAIAIGTGTTAAANADTELDTEYTRSSATITAPADYQVKFAKTFTFGSGVSEAITEAGLFDSTIVTGSTMLARTTFTAKNVTSEISLVVNATITISRI
jgi:hypothetical protein